jgi:hypothetical protein
VADSKENLVTIKIPRAIVDAFKDEQFRRRKAQRPEPTYVELIEEAWAAWGVAVPQTEPAQHGPVRNSEHNQKEQRLHVRSDTIPAIEVLEGEKEWIQKMVEVYRSGDTAAVSALSALAERVVRLAGERPRAELSGSSGADSRAAVELASRTTGNVLDEVREAEERRATGKQPARAPKRGDPRKTGTGGRT